MCQVQVNLGNSPDRLTAELQISSVWTNSCWVGFLLAFSQFKPTHSSYWPDVVTENCIMLCSVSAVPTGVLFAASKFGSYLDSLSRCQGLEQGQRNPSCYKRLCPFTSAATDNGKFLALVIHGVTFSSTHFSYLLRMGNLIADVKR